MLRKLLLPILMLLPVIGFSQRHTSTRNIASYDMMTFERYLGRNLKFPDEVQQLRIQGVVYVQFATDSLDHLIPSSVKRINSLEFACDVEAERIVKQYKGRLRWIGKSTKPFGYRHVVPVYFRLAHPAYFPAHVLPEPIEAVVATKASQTKQPAWAVYKRKGLTEGGGQISPNDTVSVIGWAAWSFFIQSQNGTGFVSHKALIPNNRLDSLVELILKKSEEEEKTEEPLQVITYDTVAASPEGSHLSLYISNLKVRVGECTTLTLAFNVAEKNRVPLQFYNLAEQLNSIAQRELNFKDGFILRDNFKDVVGKQVMIKNEGYTTYVIYHAAHCPTKAGVIKIPAITLKMLKHNADKSESVISYKTTSKNIEVTAAQKQGDHYEATGSFSLNERTIDDYKIESGKPFRYELTIEGNAPTISVLPPKFKQRRIRGQIIDIIKYDTLIDNKIYSKQTFLLEIIIDSAGTYDLSSNFEYRFYNPSLQESQILRPSKKIVVAPGNGSQSFSFPPYFNNKNIFIAFDISTSMLIEDYTPNRITAVKNGLQNFFSNRLGCEVGVIIFAGEAKHYSYNNQYCYTTSSFDDISYSILKNGTALGDAILLAASSLKDQAQGKLIIIGDGDNTAGLITPFYAAQIAKQKRLKIYTIGVGHTGAVPFGTDVNGKHNLISNTFSDKDFMEVSRITGVEYFWAKDKDDITRILSKVIGSKE